METDAAAKPAADGPAAAAKKDEPSSYTLDNPARVVAGQARFVVLPQVRRGGPA